MMFNFFLFPLIASSITMPGIPNPISDLVPGFATSSTGTGSGTVCGNSVTGPCNDVSPAQQNLQSCLVGAGTGALTGAVVGTIIPGIGNLAGAIGGAIIGGFAGCGLASTFFPSAGSAIFQSVASAAGPLGDFMNALAVALGWVGPILKFFQDMTTYEFALLVNAPEIGVWLFPFQVMMATMFLYIGAEYIRGTGIGA